MRSGGFAVALLDRARGMEQVVSSYRFLPLAGGYRVVGGESDYFLSPQNGGSCTCPDYLLRGKASGIPCKHILAARHLGLT